VNKRGLAQREKGPLEGECCALPAARLTAHEDVTAVTFPMSAVCDSPGSVPQLNAATELNGKAENQALRSRHAGRGRGNDCVCAFGNR